MNACPARSLALFTMAAVSLALGACAGDKHTMVAQKPGTTVVCQECYDQIQKVRHTSGSRWNSGYDQLHAVHQCASCRTEMSVYTEGGVTKVKCAKCAPSGVACDLCVPSSVVPPR